MSKLSISIMTSYLQHADMQRYEEKVLVPNPVYHRCANYPACTEWEVTWPDKSSSQCKVCENKIAKSKS